MSAARWNTQAQPLHRLPHGIGVANVARHHLEPAFDIGGAVVEPAPGIERIVEHEGADLAALAHEPLR